VKIVDDKIYISELVKMSLKMFGNMVKAVVDIEKEIMVVDADLHSDEEAALLKSGSKQENLWGINIYPEISGDGMIEFDSMINLRPSFNNKSRSVDSEQTKIKITEIVNKLIKYE